MAKIIAPNKDYDGISASVSFDKGVGETSDAHLLDWVRTHGYKVVEDKPKQANGLDVVQDEPKRRGKK